MNNQASKTCKIQKKRLSQEQVRLLEASFDSGKKLEPERKFQLARDLGVPPRQIAIWHQNKRARWKSQSLELDHGAMQLRLDAALAEKRELEKEVGLLRAELRRAQDMLGAAARGGGGGSSSLNEDVGCSANWPNVEELYACLMAKPVSEVVNERDYWV
ncbi:homeobox-leucine zipper protein ATHB-52-like isoform X2 [Salvia hispanica]|uniref:homeobox-leucine zipper protein ATHB-52-like isoform X2 n=1 Tax=Salvia hispanica TaxID=49212 RepID=UPI0020096E78|nr:homeobox-leucine zipper protein ATHB-52-like isoform X2 [Salvia hispanica]